MHTQIWDLRMYKNNVNQYPHIDEIKQTFLDGGLVAIPTETVYGLGANARNEEAVENIYVAKGRPSDNPLIVHIHSIEQLDDFVEYIDDKVKVLMDEFWPGPISFILPLKQGYLCSKVTGGLESIAVRMPSHKIGRALLQIVDEPIAAPSANISGRPSPTTFEHVNRDLNGKVNGIVNGDQCEEGLESTVIDCTQFPFRIARPGSITQDMIETKLPHSINRQIYEENEKPIAPGMKYKHYSPETPLTIVKDLNKKIANDDKWSKVAFVFPESQRSLIPENSIFISLCENKGDFKSAGHNLYEILHELDQNEEIEEAYIYGFEDNHHTEAIMNRMLKAASYKLIKGEKL